MKSDGWNKSVRRSPCMNLFPISLITLIFLPLTSSIALAQATVEKPSAPLKAISVVHPTAGSKVSGTGTFTDAADGVQVHAELTGLTPGKHGFHVDEFGECSAHDAIP